VCVCAQCGVASGIRGGSRSSRIKWWTVVVAAGNHEFFTGRGKGEGVHPMTPILPGTDVIQHGGVPLSTEERSVHSGAAWTVDRGP
jgi:hypothetical protein